MEYDLSAIQVASKVIAEFQPKFYPSSTKINPEYKGEPSLPSKLHVWFKGILSQEETFQKSYIKKYPVFKRALINKSFGKYRDIFEKFINTLMKDIRVQSFKDMIRWIDTPHETTVWDSRDHSPEKEPDPMEVASDELLRNDGVYGYIDEKLISKIKNIVLEEISKVFQDQKLI